MSNPKKYNYQSHDEVPDILWSYMDSIVDVEFPVKGSASNDNVAKSLLDRSRRVNTWMNSAPFQNLLLAA